MLLDTFITQVLQTTFEFSEADIEKYRKAAEKVKKTFEEYLVDEDLVNEEELYRQASLKMEVPFITLKDKDIKKDVLSLVPPALAQTHKLIAFNKSNKTMDLAMLDPEDLQTIEFLERKTGLIPTVYLTTPSDIKDALRRYHADLDSQMQIKELKEGQDEEGNLKKVAEELPIINIVNSVLEHAVYENASDIHIEPTEKHVEVRYRVDGVLRSVMTLPKSTQSGITARMKILSNLKIDEHMLPQDGRFKIQVQEDKYSFRVSIMPVYDGEKIVLRLLHEGAKPLSLDELGFQKDPEKLVAKSMKRPHGMILVTGPTGSGKTTTLYSVLGMLNNPDVNICTIEDPIEYHIEGINQSQVNPRAGFDFASGLRAFLRQDPDIIMVGEIRDQETAEIGMHAAMTGHLVLSTLHTNDAVSTIARLLDMGIPGFLLASTINLIIGQRLVRRLDEKTKKPYKLTAEMAKELEERAGGVNLASVISANTKTTAKKLTDVTFYRPDTEKKHQHDGYKGRVGIYEVLNISAELQEGITKSMNTAQLQTIARKQGMLSMFEDGVVKAAQGITSIEEVLRVTKD